jgi:VanZ family protein
MNPRHSPPSRSVTHRLIRYWLPVMALCIAIFVQSSLPSPEQLPTFAFSDKLLHLAAYGVLSVLICRAFNTIDRWHRRWALLFLMGVVGATLYGLSDEWHQSFVAARSAEAADLLADFAGSVLGAGGYLRVLWRRRLD